MEQKEYLYSQEKVLTQLVRTATNLYGYFIARRQGIFSDALAEDTGIPTTMIDNMPEWLVENGYVASESIESWCEMFEKIERGESSGSARVTLRRKNGTFGRFSLRFNTIEDEQGKPWFALVSYEDISFDHEEFTLREELRIQAEEVRLTMSQMGKIVCYYDIPSKTLTIPPSHAKLKTFSHVLTNFPDAFIASRPEYFPPTALGIIREFYRSICAGKPKGSCEYHCLDMNGMDCWERLEFVTVFSENGQPQRAIVAVENITEKNAQNAEHRRMKENEQLLQMIAQHSDRIICHYDVQKDAARMWDMKICERCQLPHLCEMTSQSVLESGDIMPASVEDLRMMFEEIRSGHPNGAIKVRAKNAKGEIRWFDLQYSTIFDGDGMPISALISHKDINEQYEHEMAYIRIVQQQEDMAKGLLFAEMDLTARVVEKVGGQMAHLLRGRGKPNDFAGGLMEVLRIRKRKEASIYFSRENLLYLYTSKERWLKSEWQGSREDGTPCWLDVDVTLLADPYTDHVKGFFYITDITAEKEAILDIQRRSELDGMTGLYNRATAEEKIRARIAQEEEPGILLILDLDDLKGINDTFGHKEGDRAIRGIAEILKSHFRETDIVGRIGGDEFIVYLTGAAMNRTAIALNLTNLLRKLGARAVGSQDEQRIHCSIGAAAETGDGESFEVLYKRADKALYHVKRNSKNSFAFYTPDMEQEDYQFQTQKLFSLQNKKRIDSEDQRHLLNAVVSFYQLVVSINLSRNDYYLMEEIDGGIFSQMPEYGSLDHFINTAMNRVHLHDLDHFAENISRKQLLEVYESGVEHVRYRFRFLNQQGEYAWAVIVIIFYVTESGDVCCFALVRWID